MKYIKMFESHELVKQVDRDKSLEFHLSHKKLNVSQNDLDILSRIQGVNRLRLTGTKEGDIITYWIEGRFVSIKFNLHKYDDEWWSCSSQGKNGVIHFIIDSDEGLFELFRKINKIYNQNVYESYKSNSSLVREVLSEEWLEFQNNHNQVTISEKEFKKIFSLFPIKDGSLRFHTGNPCDFLIGHYKWVSFRIYKYDDEYWLCYTRNMTDSPKKYRREHYFIVDSDNGLSELFEKFEEIN